MSSQKVTKVERGWPGHFICGDRCVFHRNTLLSFKGLKIVVSTVGAMRDIHSVNASKFVPIGHNRYYETMAFYANLDDTRYYDINVSKQIYFDSSWSIATLDADDKANVMHDNVVIELETKLLLAALED